MLKLIDSHVHFWQPQVLRYAWLDGLPSINRNFLPADLPRQGSDWQLEKIIFVEAACAPEQGFAEVTWVSSLADAGAPIAGIVAFAPLEQGAAAREALEQLQTLPLVKAVRRLIQAEAPGFSKQPAFIEGVRLLSEFGYPFDICVKHHQLADVLVLVRACPNVRFVLDHIGKPDIKAGQLDPWREHIRQLAAFPNVMCKLSGLVTEADTERWQPKELQPYIDHVLNCFGADRVMFGSDWPVARLATAYERWLDVLRAAVAPLSPAEIERVFHDNVQQFYGV